MKKACISTFVAALLLTSQDGIAQNLAKNDASIALPAPLASRHFSTGKLDRAQSNTQAVAREMADALTGKIETPVMRPTRSSFLAKWQPVSGATGYRLDVSSTPSFENYVPGYRNRGWISDRSEVLSLPGCRASVSDAALLIFWATAPSLRF